MLEIRENHNILDAQTKKKIRQYETVITWFSRGSFNEEYTQERYIRELGYFMRYVREYGGKFSNMTPDDLIDHQKKARRSSEEEVEYEIMDKLIRPWIQRIEVKYTDRTLTGKIHTLRSFFRYNRAPLPAEHIGTRAGVQAVVGNLPFKDIRNICLNSSDPYCAIFLCMYMGAMDKALFRYWNLVSGYKSIKDDLEKDSDIIIVRSPGRKKDVNKLPFYTMIGGDAVVALKKYVNGYRKKVIDRHFDGDPEKATAIFYNQHGLPIDKSGISRYWHYKLDKLDLIELIIDENGRGYTGNRYGKNPHEMRDTWRSKVTSFFMQEQIPLSVFEFWMGHVKKMDPNLYDKFMKDEIAVKMLYRKALPYFNIMTSNKALGLYNEEDVEREREIAREKVEKRSQAIKDSPELSALQDQLNNLADINYQPEPVD